MLQLPLSLDATSKTPLYEQLYRALVAQIRSGALPAGSRLPGKRTLAGQLGVAVNTVDTAYQILAAEGYLEARQRSGFVVQETWDPGPTPKEPAAEPAAPAPRRWRFDLGTGGVDTALFPFRTWGRIQKELLYAAPELLGHGHPQGDENLRQAIAGYLAAYRGVDCRPEQIVVGAGTEYLLGLVAGLFRGAEAAVENPGYRRVRTILENNGLTCRCTPIDESGLDAAALARGGASLCCVTPSHHFPTAVTMPAARRGQLLRWASEKPGRYLIEDDYDAEFRFDIRPLPSLQGMAGRRGPVVYLCTFSKSLAPSIRIACMVLPPELLERYRETYGDYANTVSRFEQQTLCRFMEEGHFARHLSRMRLAYKNRMEALAATLQAEFPQAILRGRHTGLHLLLTLPQGPGEAEMVAAAQAAGAGLTGLSDYYMEAAETCPPNTVVLGYAALPDRDIPALGKALGEAWR